MFKHVQGYISIDDTRIILHKNSLPFTLTPRDLKQICERGFPELSDTEVLQKVRIECLRTVPPWFSRAVGLVDKKNDWEKAPYVALEYRSGDVNKKPFRM